MKKAMISILILTVLGFWISSASAEISQDLDPMVSSEPQATGQTSNAVSAIGAAKEEKKTEEKKKKKAKKSSAKKSSPKKSSKASSQKSQTSKNSSR